MKYIIAFLLGFITTVSFSQLVFEDITSLTTSNSNLLCNRITNVMQDSSCNIWISSVEGLAKYDGQTWEYFTPNNSPLPDFTEYSLFDSEGRLWVNGWTNFFNKEVLCFDGSNWLSFSYQGSPLAGDEYPRSCADSSGCVYFATNSSGVVKFSDTGYVYLSSSTIGLSSDNVESVFVDDQQHLWIGHYGGMSIYKDSISNVIDPVNYGGGQVVDITQTNNGEMWFAASYGIAKYDGSNWMFFDSQQIFGYPQAIIRRISCDSVNNIWVGTADSGLVYYDGVNWTTYTTANGLNSDYVSNICCDIDNETWICTWDMGITIFDGQQWTNVNTLDGLSNNRVNALDCDNNGTVWFGTEYGASKYNGSNWDSFYYHFGNVFAIKGIDLGVDDKLWFSGDYYGGIVVRHSDTVWQGIYESWFYGQGPFYQILADIPNIIWVATNNGLNHIALASGSITQYVIYDTSYGLLHNTVRALAHNTNGDLIIGTWGGINIFDGLNFSTLAMPATEQLSNQVTSLLFDHQGKLWVGTTDGLGCYDGQNWIVYKTSEGLANNYINALYQTENDSVWVATRNGISQLNGNSFASFYKADGLIADNITDIVEDLEGNMYFSSHYGVSKVDAGYLGINTPNKNRLQVCPNPALNKIKVFAPGNCGSIEVYNISGQLCKRIVEVSHVVDIDISDFSPGQYFIRVNTGQKVWVEKFVVVR